MPLNNVAGQLRKPGGFTSDDTSLHLAAMRSVIFDLDGTLADTSGDLIAAANSCFQGLGLGDLLDPAKDTATALRGGRAMLTLGFSRVQGFGAAEIERQYPKLLTAYRGDIDSRTHLYDGAMKAVFDLQSEGYKVGICTNKPYDLADLLLRRLGVRAAFASLIGADSLPVKKPDAAPLIAAVKEAGGNPARACLIGDTDTDLQTAANAGMPSVLVSFGPGAHLVQRKPDHRLGDFADLLALVEGMAL